MNRVLVPYIQRRTTTVVMIAGLLALIVLVTTLEGLFGVASDIGRFKYFSICRHCAKIEHTTEWRVPFTHIAIVAQPEITDTPLSRMLISNRLIPAHTHDWKFCSGGGNGIRCALGDGREIIRAANSTELTTLISTLHQRGETAFRDRILSGILDETTSTIYSCALVGEDISKASDKNLKLWIAKQNKILDYLEATEKRIAR